MKKHTCHLDLHQRSHYVTIGLKNWARKLFDNQKEKLLDKQHSSNQPNQFQIQTVIYQGKLGITQDVIRKTSRSQEISVNSFNEELCSSDRSGRPGITQDVISVQACSSEDKSLNVEQTHDRSGQLDKHIVAVQDDPEVYHEAETLNIDNETIRERIEADMDFKIPGLPHSIVKLAQSTSIQELIQKIENHPNRHALQRDLRQSHSFNPFSPESKQMIHEVGNIELCELLDTEPKTQCKVCLSYWDIGIVYCTIGHFLRRGTEKNKKFIQYTMDLLSIPDFFFLRKGRLHGHRYGKKPGDREYYIANPLKRSARRRTSRVSMTDLYEMTNSAGI